MLCLVLLLLVNNLAVVEVLGGEATSNLRLKAKLEQALVAGITAEGALALRKIEMAIRPLMRICIMLFNQVVT